MEKKNALIGAAVGYGPEQLKNFIVSFRQVNKTDDIVLFVEEYRKQYFNSAFSNFNVTFETIDPSQYNGPVNNTRFLKYLEYLRNNTQYKNIITSDVRDVYFQKDPFVDLPDDDFLFVFKEDSGVTFKDDLIYNSYWIESLFGRERLEELYDYTFICSGVIIASIKSIIDLFAYMEPTILSERAWTVMTDQAVLNHLCFSNTMKEKINFIIKNNGDIVGTIGNSMKSPKAADKLGIDSAGIISVNNNICSIIHQYDRNDHLTYFLNFKYSKLYDSQILQAE